MSLSVQFSWFAQRKHLRLFVTWISLYDTRVVILSFERKGCVSRLNRNKSGRAGSLVIIVCNRLLPVAVSSVSVETVVFFSCCRESRKYFKNKNKTNHLFDLNNPKYLKSHRTMSSVTELMKPSHPHS